MPKTLYFSLEDISCDACPSLIYNLLEDYFTTQSPYKIDSHSVDTKSVTIYIDDNQPEQAIIQTIKHKITEFGFTCEYLKTEYTPQIWPSIDDLPEPDENYDDGDEGQGKSENQSPQEAGKNYKFIYSLILGVLGIVVGAVVMGLMLSGLALPVYATYIIVFGCAFLTLALGLLGGFYWKAIKGLFNGKDPTMDTLFTISTLTVIAVSIASLFVPMLHGMIEAGLFIFGFRHVGEAIKESLKQKTDDALLFEKRCAQTVEKYYGKNDWRVCKSAKLIPGNFIRVKSGEIIPIDGKCMSIKASVTTSDIDGNTGIVKIKEGGQVLSGMKVSGTEDIYIKVYRPLSTSYLARLRKECERAMSKRSDIEEIASTILKYFIPAVLVVAIVSSIFVGIFLTPALALQFVILLLVFACPCTLGSVSSIAIKTGMSKAYDKGKVRFASSKALEEATNIDIVVFDYNGTLTKGVYDEVRCIADPEKKMDQEDFLAYLALMEEECNHPIATAIHDHVLKQKPDTTKLIVNTPKKILSGGVLATINGEKCLIGNKDFLLEQGITSFKKVNIRNPSTKVIYLVINGEVVGHVEIEDPIREDAKFVIKELSDMGKKIYICTGDESDRAVYISGKFNIPIENIYTNATSVPVSGRTTKQEHIKNLQKNNQRVAVVGDAANDLLMIRESDFSIAITSPSGSLETQKYAKAVIYENSLLSVLAVFSISEETVSNIKKSIIFSLSYNMLIFLIAGGILIGLGFVLHPAIGAALMIVQMTAILLYQEYIRQKELPYEGRYNEFKKQKELKNTTYKELFGNELQPGKKEEKVFSCSLENTNKTSDNVSDKSPTSRLQEEDVNVLDYAFRLM